MMEKEKVKKSKAAPKKRTSKKKEVEAQTETPSVDVLDESEYGTGKDLVIVESPAKAKTLKK
jgi:hypothetical protein